MHTCLHGGLLFGETMEVPEAPFDFAFDGFEVACNRLGCERCGDPVLSRGGVAVRPGARTPAGREVYEALSGGPGLAPDDPWLVAARGARLWGCACGVLYRVDDGRAPIGLREDLELPPPEGWRCLGHPPFVGGALDGEPFEPDDAASLSALVSGAILGSRAVARPQHTWGYPAQWTLRLASVSPEPIRDKVLACGLACAHDDDLALVSAGLDLWRRRPADARRLVAAGQLKDLDEVHLADEVSAGSAADASHPGSLSGLFAEALAFQLILENDAKRSAARKGALVAVAVRLALATHHPRLLAALTQSDPDALLSILPSLVKPRLRVGVLGALVLGISRRPERAADLFVHLARLGVAGQKLDALRAQYRV